MNIADLLSYVAPLIPAVSSMVNDWKDWRKKHTKRPNVLLMLTTLVIAWMITWSANRQHDTEESRMQRDAQRQSQALSDLQSQNRALIAQNDSLDKGVNQLQDRNRDLQSDMDALRQQFKVKASRTRGPSEKLTTSDSVQVTVTRAKHP
jgi:predicted RNase H-like nuclease (RuvC/YqgF family)